MSFTIHHPPSDRRVARLVMSGLALACFGVVAAVGFFGVEQAIKEEPGKQVEHDSPVGAIETPQVAKLIQAAPQEKPPEPPRPAFTGDNPRLALKNHPQPLVKVVYSADGKTLYSASSDGHVRSWDAVSLQDRAEWTLPGKSALKGIAVTHDETQLALVYGYNETRLLNLKTKAETLLEPHRPGAGDRDGYVEFAPDGKALAVIMAQGYPHLFSSNAFLWETRAKVRLHEFSHGTRALRYSADGKTRVVASVGNTLSVWRPNDSKEYQHFKADPNSKESYRVSPESGMLVVSSDGTWTASLWEGVDLRRWNLETKTQLDPIVLADRKDFRRPHFSVLALHPNDRLLAVAGNGRVIDFYDLQTGKKRGRVTVAVAQPVPIDPRIPIRDLAFSPDGKTLGIALGHTPILWDVAELKLEKLEGVADTVKPRTPEPPTPAPPDRALPTATTLPLDKDRTHDASLGADDLAEDGHRFKLYLLPLKAGQSYQFELHSNDFDGFLRLLSPRGDLLASDDDSAGGRHARLRFTPPFDGVYRLQATSHGKDAVGKFTLTARRCEAESPPAKIDFKSADVDTGVPFRPTETKFANGLTAYTFLVAPQRKYRGDVFWSDDSKTITVLDDKGTLRRVNVETWTEEKRLDLKERCINLALSKVGWMVAAQVLYGELYVLDKSTFAVRHRVNPPSLVRVASAPHLSVAVTATHVDAFRGRADDAPADDKGAILIMPFTGDRVPKMYDKRSVRGLTMSPDGQYVFVQSSNNGVRRYRLDDKNLDYGDGLDSIAADATGIGVSPDSKLWWLPGPKGNTWYNTEPAERLNEKPFSTFFWRTDRLHDKPEFIVPAGPGTRVAAHNPKTGDFYLHNRQRQLLVIGRNGQHRAELTLEAKDGDNEPLEFRLSPDGKKLLIRFEKRLTLVDVAGLDAPTVKRPSPQDSGTIQRVLFARAGKCEFKGSLSGTDLPPGDERLARVFYLTLDRLQLVNLELETSKRVAPQLDVFGPDGRLLTRTKTFYDFGGNRTRAQLLSETPGVYKVVVTTRDGQSKTPFTLKLVLTGTKLTTQQLLPLAPPPVPIAGTQTLKTTPLDAVGPLKATTVAVSTLSLVVSPDGKTAFLLDNEGSLLRVNTATWTVEKKLPAAGRISAVQLSALGLLARVGHTELWLIDPQTLEVTRQYEAPGLLDVTTSAQSPLAIVTVDPRGEDYTTLYGERASPAKVLDLKTGDYIVQPYNPHHDSSMPRPCLAPDGVNLFHIASHTYDATKSSMGHKVLQDGTLKGVGWYPIALYRGIRPGVTPDGKVVYVHHDGTTWGTNANVPPPYKLPFYRVAATERRSEVRTPILELALPARPRAVAFDQQANFILVGHANKAVQFYDWKGKLLADRDLPPGEVVELVVAPEGGKALARCADRLVVLDYRELPASMVTPPPEVVEAEKPPQVDGVKITVGQPIKEGNLTYRALALPRTQATAYCWDADGKYLFIGEQRGVVHRLRFEGFVDEAQAIVGTQLSSLMWTAEGLTARDPATHEILLIDSEKLTVRARLPCPRSAQMVAARQSSLLVVTSAALDNVSLFDLKQRKLLARGIENLPAATKTLRFPVLSPDGKYLFFSGAESDNRLHRVRIEPTRLVHDGSRPAPTAETYACIVAPDARHVYCYPYYQREKDPSPVVVYPVESWDKPAWTWQEHLRQLAFDQQGTLFGVPRSGNVRGSSFKRFAPPLRADSKGTMYPWEKGACEWLRPHPQGRGLLVRFTDSANRRTSARLYFVELTDAAR